MGRTWIGDWLDARDLRRAIDLRVRLGARGWLASWRDLGPGRWAARLSAPGFPVTIERPGRSRLAALRRAEGALAELIANVD